MGGIRSVLRAALSGRADANIRFAELVRLPRRLGFGERIRGGHHIFTGDGMDEIINLQPKGGMAKPYQVKQVREIVTRHQLGVDRDY